MEWNLNLIRNHKIKCEILFSDIYKYTSGMNVG
jgi:hypothetical protein